MRKLAPEPAERERLQQAIDWMFMLTVEWFGLPDDLKQHTEQLDFGFKGQSNDQLRQTWMSATVPLCEELGFRIPAHYDAAAGKYVIDCAFPAAFDEREKRWLLDEGAISWTDVMARWKRRGPMNEEFVETLQRGRKGLDRLARD